MKKILLACGLLGALGVTAVGLASIKAAWEQPKSGGIQGMPRRYATYKWIPSDDIISRLHRRLFGPPEGDPVTYQHFYSFSIQPPSSPWVGALMAAGGAAALCGLAAIFRRKARR